MQYEAIAAMPPGVGQRTRSCLAGLRHRGSGRVTSCCGELLYWCRVPRMQKIRLLAGMVMVVTWGRTMPRSWCKPKGRARRSCRHTLRIGQRHSYDTWTMRTSRCTWLRAVRFEELEQLTLKGGNPLVVGVLSPNSDTTGTPKPLVLGS